MEGGTVEARDECPCHGHDSGKGSGSLGEQTQREPIAGKPIAYQTCVKRHILSPTCPNKLHNLVPNYAQCRETLTTVWGFAKRDELVVER